MIAVDTNILARFYCDDPDDVEAKRQRPRARRVMLESAAVFVPLTVILEFEWVMRGFYEVEPETFRQTIEHLLGMPHVTVERWEAVKDAVDLHRKGLDFADALHWVCSAACRQFVSFDDRGFVRRAKRLKLVPDVTVPGT
ncbi:MAG: type II toxin-antitoxin system VapC family toxin [Sulfuritalea sp.]|nr:type II toxin-antitoxin system VapC family toxin [Sulfuritalea sp.]